MKQMPWKDCALWAVISCNVFVGLALLVGLTCTKELSPEYIRYATPMVGILNLFAYRYLFHVIYGK